MTLVKQRAPNFIAPVVMPNGEIDDNFELYKYLTKVVNCDYAMLMFYPLDFTFVCPTEIITASNMIEEYKTANAAILAISIDSHFAHLAWRKTERKDGGIGNVNIPLVSDLSKDISRSYNVLLNNSVALRATFIMHKETDEESGEEFYSIFHESINDLPIGRDIEAALNNIHAFQTHKESGAACPAQWKQGRATLDPTQEGISKYLSAHEDDLNNNE